MFKQIQTEKEPIIFDHEVEQEVQTAPRVLSLNDLANLDAAEIADEEEEVILKPGVVNRFKIRKLTR